TSVHRWDPHADREEVRKRVVAAGLNTRKLALSPDGRSLGALIANRGDPQQKRGVTCQVRVYDLKTNKFMELLWPSPRISASQLRFTPDSRRLTTRAFANNTCLWDRDTGKFVYEFKRKETSAPLFQPLTFAADGRSFLTWSGGLVRIHELAGRTDRLQ